MKAGLNGAMHVSFTCKRIGHVARCAGYIAQRISVARIISCDEHWFDNPYSRRKGIELRNPLMQVTHVPQLVMG